LLTHVVSGAVAFNSLGEYACRLRYRKGAWQLQGDTQFTPGEGIAAARKQGAVPVANMRLALSAKGMEKSLPQPLARVKRISGKSELDALLAECRLAFAGKFDANDADAWFFLPEATPLTFTVYAVKTPGKKPQAADRIASYALKKGQAFVYSGNWLAWDKTTESMAPQFVLSASHKASGRESFLFSMPENENDGSCPGFVPLEK